mmetsp:Transcript_36603/g.103227  ORF Transcript_36603/g.103227 Transcript_36603/m.103227 type:complete len:202 (+) Transcript_36603:118-723(+)
MAASVGWRDTAWGCRSAFFTADVSSFMLFPFIRSWYFIRRVSDMRVARSMALAGPRSRRQPMTKSSTLMFPVSSMSRRSKRPHASERSKSIDLKYASNSGLFSCFLNSCQEIISAPCVAKALRRWSTISMLVSSLVLFSADSTKMPVITLSIENMVKAMNTENRSAIAGEISSIRGSQITCQFIPPLMAWKSDRIDLPIEP